MSITIVIGSQSGDEGKGKIVDYLTNEVLNPDIVIRAQGGSNAGHTVINNFGTFKLHSIPSGIFNPATKCILGPGTVINPDLLLAELKKLELAGIDTSNVIISDQAHILTSSHIKEDKKSEISRGEKKIGTTGNGIGPAYAHKAYRTNLRFGDILDLPLSDKRIKQEWIDFLGHRIKDTTLLLYDARIRNRNIIIEAQCGFMRDLDHGTYPYVTSSSLTAAGVLQGAGLPPTKVDRIVGVVKAYMTSVGEGPMPTEDMGKMGDLLRSAGNEYGATTGRPRRCGWLDIPVLRKSNLVNGFTELALTKIDVLDGIPRIPICDLYSINGKRYLHSMRTKLLYDVRPLYSNFFGWNNTKGIKTFDNLPKTAKTYISYIESQLGCSFKYICNGPKREDIILKEK